MALTILPDTRGSYPRVLLSCSTLLISFDSRIPLPTLLESGLSRHAMAYFLDEGN